MFWLALLLTACSDDPSDVDTDAALDPTSTTGSEPVDTDDEGSKDTDDTDSTDPTDPTETDDCPDYTVVLDTLVSEFSTKDPGEADAGSNHTSLFHYALPPGALTDPDVRVYFYLDYHIINLTPPEYFQAFWYALAPEMECPFDIRNDMFVDDDDWLVTEAIVDESGVSPVSLPTAPYGGAAGWNLGDGVNVFDLTEIPTSLCGNVLPKEVMVEEPGMYEASYIANSGISSVRDGRLYLGHRDCVE